MEEQSVEPTKGKSDTDANPGASSPQGIQQNGTVEVKISDWITAGFNLYKDNFALVLGATAMTILLGAVTVGVLAGPLLAGTFLILFSLIDKIEKKPEFGDLFNKGFSDFLNPFLFVLVTFIVSAVGGNVLGRVPGLGGILSFLFSITLGACLMFGIPLIADQKLQFLEAAKKSFELVQKNMPMFILLHFVLYVISLLGALAFIVGVFFTVPIYLCTVAVAYRELFSKTD